MFNNSALQLQQFIWLGITLVQMQCPAKQAAGPHPSPQGGECIFKGLPRLNLMLSCLHYGFEVKRFPEPALCWMTVRNIYGISPNESVGRMWILSETRLIQVDRKIFSFYSVSLGLQEKAELVMSYNRQNKHPRIHSHTDCSKKFFYSFSLKITNMCFV